MDFKPLLVQLAKNDSKSSVRAAAFDKLANNTHNSEADFSLFEFALKDSSALVQGTALKGMNASSPEKTQLALASIEKTAKGSMLSSIAAIYANSAVAGKFDFLKDAYAKINNPNEKYLFIQMMGKYALSQDEAIKTSAISTFENMARNEDAWWLRLAGIQVIAEYQMEYSKKLDQLNAEIASPEGLSASESVKAEKLKEKANLVLSITSIESMLESIFAAEKDSNLIRILSGGQ
jgi:hypothetical protein